LADMPMLPTGAPASIPASASEFASTRGSLMAKMGNESDSCKDQIASQSPPQVIDDRAKDFKAHVGARFNFTANNWRQASRKKAAEEIAILPLTKFSGIPLVNLGDSDSDLSKRLATAGTVEITIVKPWTVWSVKRHGSQDCGLQVFSRNGVVEAIRVQDKSVWTNQQGIVLGDEISVVKEKFGEPAFILSHPIPSGNKTYVYPISQVAFRMRRTVETDPPRIKDIIIFNVK